MDDTTNDEIMAIAREHGQVALESAMIWNYNALAHGSGTPFDTTVPRTRLHNSQWHYYAVPRFPSPIAPTRTRLVPSRHSMRPPGQDFRHVHSIAKLPIGLGLFRRQSPASRERCSIILLPSISVSIQLTIGQYPIPFIARHPSPPTWEIAVPTLRKSRSMFHDVVH